MLMNRPEGLEEMIDAFRKLPGVGEKSAMRMALHVLEWESVEQDSFLEKLKRGTELSPCPQCGVLKENLADGSSAKLTEKLTEESSNSDCPICQKDHQELVDCLCVVENFSDYWAIASTSKFDGNFHVLGGLLNPLRGIGPRDIRLEPLFERVQKSNFKKIVLGLSPSIEGDATSDFIHEKLSPVCEVERIGYGIPMGGSIEYFDAATIGVALENTKPMR